MAPPGGQPGQRPNSGAPQQQLEICAAPSPAATSTLRNSATRLRQVFSTRAARLGTLHELTKLTPVAILADALGYSPATIERHAVDSATAYARYVGAIRSESQTL